MAPRKTGVEKGCNRVNAKGPRDGKVNKELDPIRILRPFIDGVQGRPATDHIDKEVTVENDHVVEEHRMRGWVEKDVKKTVSLTDVHHDEKKAHGNGPDGQELSKDGEFPVIFVIVKIVG